MVFDIGTVIAQWQTAGIYDYLLPFLLIFAIVFGILTTTKVLGDQRGIGVLIAIIIGLMAIGYNYSSGFPFSDFLKELFPRLGIGLAVLLTLLILIGLFVSENDREYWLWGLGAIAVIIAIVVVTNSFERFGFGSGNYESYVGWIIGAVLLLGLIIAVGASGNKSESEKEAKIEHLKHWR